MENIKVTPHKFPKKLTPDKQFAFLAVLSDTAQVGKACKAVGISRGWAYELRKRDANFSHAWDEAMKIGYTTLEDEALRRGRDGIDKKVFHNGVVTGTVKEYSNTLLAFLLKGNNEKYEQRSKTDITNSDGSLAKMSNSQIAAALSALSKTTEDSKDVNSGEDLV